MFSWLKVKKKMNKYLEQIEETVSFLKKISLEKVDIVLILGTGLGDLVELLQDSKEFLYSEIPNFLMTTAPSHQGKLVFGHLYNKNIVIMQGRMHYYEGYSLKEITFPIRIFRKLGAELIIITNAAGSLNPNFRPKDLVLITDHINFIGHNPLVGNNLNNFGERFPSMHNAYDKHLQEKMMKIANENHITLKQGIYVAVTGPSLETTAECRMLQKMGADMVGMSTVPEVIVAIHSKMKVLAISVITNMSNLFHNKPHIQQNIEQTASTVKKSMMILLSEFIKQYRR
ncbi:MAG: purine-nucleoside phosphorylase [Candidatus Cloacimonadota bacterium]|nr:MAG: purine-nucleoside phosphorylase [Candidatus Cloacimonadota bacterium]